MRLSAITSNSSEPDYADLVPGAMPFRGMRLPMKIPALAVAFVAAAVIIFAAKSSKHEETVIGDTSALSAAAQVPSPVKTLTSASCASDGCPVACETGDTLLSAVCVSGSKGRFADTLRVQNGALTATCGTTASSILVYCGRP
jgi:hypothetical protein